MMKRMVGSAVAVVGLVALAGCANTPTGSSDADGMTWSMWIGSSEDQKAWETVGAAGGEAAGVTVSLQGAPFVDYWTKLSTQLGTPNAPCIVSMQSLRLNQFTSGLLPLDDLAADSDVDLSEFDPGALAAMESEGKLYALPYDTGPLVLFYNRDAFADAGIAEPAPGWTTAEFEDAAGKLQDAGTVAFGTTVEDLYLESTVLALTGGEMIASDGSVDLTSPDVAEGIDYLADMVEAGTATRANGPDSTADENAFLAGSVASVVGGPWLMLDFLAKADFEVGVATIPAGTGGGQTYSAGSGFGISSTCSQPEKAFEAITTMTSADVLSQLATDGRAFPARTASQQDWYTKVGTDGVQTAMEAALASAVPLPGSTNADKLNQLLAQYGPQMVNGERPASEVLTEMNDQLSR